MISDRLRKDERTIDRGKCFPRDEGGVSEVLGTILVLAITVVLFTSVFAAVTQLEAPEERDHADLDARMERDNATAYIFINHTGGGTLEMKDLNFIVLASGNPVDPNDVKVHFDFDDWSPGKRVIIEIDNADVNVPPDEKIELIVRSEDTSRIVYDTTLVDIAEEPLSIRWARIAYPYEWRDYAEPEEQIDIRAEVSIAENFELDQIEARVSPYDIFEEGKTIELTELRGNIYNETVTIDSDAETRQYSVKITAMDIDDNITVEEYLPLGVGVQTADLYRPELVVGDFEFNPGSPSHGDELTITAKVYNQGKVNYTAEWEMKDDDEKVGDGVTTFASGPAPTRITTTYDVEGHGPHEIEVNLSTELHEGNVIGSDPVEDVEPRTSRRTEILHVDPYVMVVRDELGQELREARIMENALRGMNLDYSVRDINSEDDIPDNSDEFRDELNESSVVVWMSGNRTDKVNIGDSIADQAVYDFIVEDEGVFWLIGSNLNDVTFGNLGNKLGATDFTSKELTDTAVFKGNGGTYGDSNYTVGPSEDYLTIDNIKGDFKNFLVNEEQTDQEYGVGYEDIEKQRTAVNSFLFENVMDPGQRSVMTSKVIEWLTNMTTRSGVDVAVSAQRIDPTAPMYMDEVNITATLRNNGPEDLYVTVRCVRNRGEEVLRPEERGAVFLPKNGGTNTTTFTWTAEELGVQEFIVHADYHNEIDEVNLRNNDITYKDLEVTDDIIEVNVHYSTLVVDADLSDEVVDYYNATADIIDSFKRLGHESGIDYEYYQVEGSLSNPEDGPDFDMMSEYNAVFWVTGERDQNVLTTADVNNLQDYVEQDSGANLMFIGEHLLDYLEGEEDVFLENVVGIRSGSVQQLGSEPSELIGREDDPISYGLKYQLDGTPELETFDTLDAEVLFEDEDGSPLASINDDGTSKVIHMGVNLSRLVGPLVDEKKYEDWPEGNVDLTHQSAREEFIYTTLWQLGKRDSRAELRVVDHDIEFSTDKPHTGRSYEIEVEVQNIGYRGTSTLIRAKEGEDYIGSETAFVEGSERGSEEGSTYFEVDPGTVSVEITWRPSYAGNRDIRVRVDPLRRSREISEDGESEDNKLMEFNNQATVIRSVYFFYDDMERGEENWNHDSTLVNIDGNGPLDFVDREDVNTNVVGDWSDDYSGMTTTDGASVYGGEGSYETDNEDVEEWTDGASHTSPRSYWMPETFGAGGGERKPIDLVLVIDESGSMGWGTRMEDAKQAAKSAVGMLREGDRVEVLSFESGLHRRLPLNDNDAQTDSKSDRQHINTTYIDPISDGGGTSLLDASSMSIEDLDDWGRDNAVKGTILLTDGVSNSDDEDRKFAPGTGGNEPEEPGIVQQYSDGNGLLGIPYNVFTVTIGNSPDARMHSISATSTADVAYGVYESDSAKLKSLFQMFVAELIETSRGGLKSMPIRPSRTNTEYRTVSTDSENDLNGDTVEDTEFMVFSDGFRTEDWTVPGYGDWSHPGFEYSEWELDWDGYRTCIKADSNGESVSQTIDPSVMLNEMSGSYSIEGAYVSFLLETEETWGWDPDQSSLNMRIDGADVFTGMEYDGGDYHKEDISSYVSGEDSFDLKFIHDGDSGADLWLDDVMVTYELDYTPGEDDEEGGYSSIINTDSQYRFLTTPSIDVSETKAERLRFQSRYKMTQGTNGGIMYLWGNDGGNWNWEKNTRRYIRPEQSYTGNLLFNEVDNHSDEGGPMNDNGLIDREDELPYWAFNGRSASGTFDWSYTSVNISQYENFTDDYDELRVVFVLAQMGGITSESGWEPDMGWYIDNVKLKVTRDFEGEVPENGHGYWMRVNETEVKDKFDNLDDSHNHITKGYYEDHTPGENGEGHYWMYARNDGGEPALPIGVDSSLYTSRIDLTNAENPEFTANLKFNIDNRSGVPPDGIRIEISEDDGRSWETVSYGVRSSWGFSGDDVHGGYSGESDEDDYGWVDTMTLIRINSDLTGYRGENIIIRFRVFTNTTDNYEDVNYPKAVFIDDVIVREQDMGMSNSIAKTEIRTEERSEGQEGYPAASQNQGSTARDRDMVGSKKDTFEETAFRKADILYRQVEHGVPTISMHPWVMRSKSYYRVGEMRTNVLSTRLKRRDKLC
ncbi:MAG: CARDB domain-containing protein [Candidatus Thermoplasmatota archaeon]